MWVHDLIRKLTLIANILTSTTKKIITINAHITKYILSNFNQIIKFGQLRQYNVGNTFCQISWRTGGREPSCRPLLFFKKALSVAKPSEQHLSFNIFC